MNLNARAVIISIFLLLAAPVILANEAIAPLPQACLSACIQPFNKILGQSPRGVVAYSNCSERTLCPSTAAV